jgi:hypothetical protein
MTRFVPTLEDLETRSVPALFGPPALLGSVSLPAAAVVSDFDRDGNLDVASATAGDGTLAVFLNNGNGTFRRAATLSDGPRPTALATADFDQNGLTDLVVASAQSNTVTVFLAFPGQSYQALSPFPVGPNPTALVTADFNRDGRPDVATLNAGGPSVSVLFGLAGGFLQPAATLPASGTGLATADFNRDGIADLAAGGAAPGSIQLLFGVAGQPPRLGTVATIDNPPAALTAADFNADGLPDLAALTSRNDFRLYFNNNGDGTLRPAGGFPAFAGPALVAADLNTDGLADLAVGGATFVNRGGGTFLPTQPLGTGVLALAAGDLNRDGRPDLVASSGNTLVQLANTFTGPSAADVAFLQQVYIDLLRRPLDPTGQSAWGGLLGLGVPRSLVARLIGQSGEALRVAVDDNYRRFLGRPADPTGLAAFTGLPEAPLQALLLGSAEYFARAGGTNVGFLRALYRDVLGRELDASGERSWAQALDQGFTRTQVAAAVSGSAEGDARRIDRLFQRFLGRGADPFGLNAFRGQPTEEVVVAILGSAEYAGRAGG